MSSATHTYPPTRKHAYTRTHTLKGMQDNGSLFDDITGFTLERAHLTSIRLSTIRKVVLRILFSWWRYIKSSVTLCLSLFFSTRWRKAHHELESTALKIYCKRGDDSSNFLTLKAFRVWLDPKVNGMTSNRESCGESGLVRRNLPGLFSSETRNFTCHRLRNSCIYAYTCLEIELGKLARISLGRLQLNYPTISTKDIEKNFIYTESSINKKIRYHLPLLGPHTWSPTLLGPAVDTPLCRRILRGPLVVLLHISIHFKFVLTST